MSWLFTVESTNEKPTPITHNPTQRSVTQWCGIAREIAVGFLWECQLQPVENDCIVMGDVTVDGISQTPHLRRARHGPQFLHDTSDRRRVANGRPHFGKQGVVADVLVW